MIRRNVGSSRVVFHGDARGRCLRAFECIRHDQRDELSIVINLVVLEGRPAFSWPAVIFKTVRRTIKLLRISVMQNRENTGHFLGFARIDAHDFSRADRASNTNSPCHIVERVLDAILRRAGYFHDAIDARDVFSDD